MPFPEPHSTPKIKSAPARVLRHVMRDLLAWLFPGIVLPSSTADRRGPARKLKTPVVKSKEKAAKSSLRTVLVRYAVTTVVVAALSYATAATLVTLTGTSYTETFDGVGTSPPCRLG